MLYDKRWGQKVAVQPSLAGLIAWLEKQDPEAQYRFMPCAECALGQYLASIGTSYGDVQWSFPGLLQQWNDVVTWPMPHTFGAALERARESQL